MIKGLVSIITPTYNHQEFLADCIESALNQTYENWEMIIVDDGSTDGTFSVAQKYDRDHSNVHSFTQKNVGPFRLDETYNFALSKSQGEFIAILEGDDYWEKDKLSLQVSKMNAQPDAVLCWGGAVSVEADTQEVIMTHPNKSFDRSHFSNDPSGEILKTLYFGNCIPALTILIRRNALLEIGGFLSGNELPLVDYPTLLELSLKGPFAFVDEVVGAWRIYANQVTKKYTVQIQEGLFASASQHFKRNESTLSSLVNWEDVEKLNRKRTVINLSRAGRYALIRKEYKAARKSYIKSIKSRGGWSKEIFLWKVRSFIGIIGSIFHFNVEGLAKLMGKQSYN